MAAAAAAGKRWRVTYTNHMKQKRKVYHDGFLELSASAHKVVLYDEGENLIESKFLKKDGTFECGGTLTLEAHLVDIGELQGDQKPLIRESSKTIHRVSRKVEVVGSSATESLPIKADSALKEWSALYTTQLTQKAKKYHDGILRLMQVGPHAKQIILLDEEGGILGSRYLKSAECVESGMKCQLPSYLIEICEPRSQKEDVVKRSSEEALSFTSSKSGKNTSSKTGQMSNPPKFTSPLQFDDLQNGQSECNTSSNRPQIGKSTSSNMDDPLRTAYQILSIMKKPSPEVKCGKRIRAEQAHSSASSGPKIVHEESQSKRTVNLSGMDHLNRTVSGSSKCESSQFATQFHTSAGSCLKVKTSETKSPIRTHHEKEYSQNDHATFDHQFIRRPAVFMDPGLAIGETPASAMLNAKDQQPDSSRNHHTGSSNDFAPVMSATSISTLPEGKSGTADQLCTKNTIEDGRCDRVPSLAATTMAWRNSKIQKLVDDCPTFDLGV